MRGGVKLVASNLPLGKKEGKRKTRLDEEKKGNTKAIARGGGQKVSAEPT